MCPNCVTPWKCNGPHIPEDDLSRQFAHDLIKHYGEDRFYHSCLRTSSVAACAGMWLALNCETVGEDETRRMVEYLESIGIHDSIGIREHVYLYQQHISSAEELRFDDKNLWENLCRVSFGFCRWWREFGLKTHKLPVHIHARMILGENNEWTRNYTSLVERFPDW
jgi:hypothetical protein